MNSNVRGKEEMQKYISAIVMLVVLCGLAVTGRAKLAEPPDIPGVISASPIDHEAIRASIIDPAPSHYTIDVRKFANIGVNEDAPTFALYVTSSLPSKCGDFTDRELPYWKPSKYKRTFNLEGQEDVLKALDTFGCVVIANTPPQG